MTMKMLIAEDSRPVAKVVAFGARMTWPDCTVSIAGNGLEALTLFEETSPDIVVLDIELPPPDGFELCRHIREVSGVPILMLTVRDSTLDKVRALDLGADDYMTKPFDHTELLARLRALMRRTASTGMISGAPSNIAASGGLTVDFQTHEVRVDGKLVVLTTIEFRLLEVLMRRAGQVVKHETLLAHVWGPEYTGDVHYLKVFVQRLRRKLHDTAEHPRYIRTEWGLGYQFIAPTP